MKYANHNKIKMATRVTGRKKDRDKVYEEFFKNEVDAVKRGAVKPIELANLLNK